MVAEAGAERLRGVVGPMWIEEMDPEEVRPVSRGPPALLEPCASGGNGAVGAPLCERLGVAAGKGVIVDVESTGKAESPMERKSRNERRRLVPGVVKSLGKSWDLFTKRE